MVLGMLRNRITNNSSKFRGEAGAESPLTFDIADFLSGDVAVTAGVRSPIGEVTIGPQREVAFGFGNVALDPQNQGRIYMDLVKADDSSLNGDIHLVVADNEGDRRDTVASFKLSDIRSGATSVFDRIPLTLQDPNGRGFASFNNRLIIEYTPTASETIVKAKSKGVIWATRRKTQL